jgi:hypothetical protein
MSPAAQQQIHVVVGADGVAVYEGADLASAKLVETIPSRRPSMVATPEPFPGVDAHQGPVRLSDHQAVQLGAVRRTADGAIYHGPASEAFDEATAILRAQVTTNPYARPALRLVESGRVCELNYAAVTDKYSPEIADHVMGEGMVVPGGRFEQSVESSFIANRDPEGMAQVLVHEADHALQHHVRRWTSLEQVEFEARVAEREYLRTEVAAGRPEPASASLITSQTTDQEIWDEVVRATELNGEQALGPGWAVDVEAAANEYLAWLNEVFLAQLQ